MSCSFAGFAHAPVSPIVILDFSVTIGTPPTIILGLLLGNGNGGTAVTPSSLKSDVLK